MLRDIIIIALISLVLVYRTMLQNDQYVLSKLLQRGVCESVIETTNGYTTRWYYRCMCLDNMASCSYELP